MVEKCIIFSAQAGGTNHQVAAVPGNSGGAYEMVVGGPNKTSTVADPEINKEADVCVFPP